MPRYEFKELKNIEKAEVLPLLARTQELRQALVELTQAVLKQRPPAALILPPGLCLMVLGRITEGSLSCELLAAKNRVRDFAILLLSLYELQLDLMYIALERGREETWLSHTQENKKPWKVRAQQDALFSDLDEHDAEMHLYRRLSMVKHCNPAGEGFAFPMTVQKGAWILERAKENEDLVGIYLFALGGCLYRAGDAAIRILTREGFELSRQEARSCEIWERLGRLNEQHVISMLNDIAADHLKRNKTPERDARN
jgi:hypothetical protein